MLDDFLRNKFGYVPSVIPWGAIQNEYEEYCNKLNEKTEIKEIVKIKDRKKSAE